MRIPPWFFGAGGPTLSEPPGILEGAFEDQSGRRLRFYWDAERARKGGIHES